MYDALGDYLLGLPDHLRETVLFVQVAEGSTGDEGVYKHKTPDNSDYEITEAEYDASLWTPPIQLACMGVTILQDKISVRTMMKDNLKMLLNLNRTMSLKLFQKTGNG